jgi:lipopolysaccharide heptosyltransferase II
MAIARGEGPIVVFGFPAIGDFIRGHSMIRLLRERYPQRPIDAVTSVIAAEVAQFMPGVRSAFGYESKHSRLMLAERTALARRLRKENYQTAYVLQSTYKAALIPFLAGIPERIGWLGEFRYPLINQPRFGQSRCKRMVDEMATLALAPGQGRPLAWPGPQLVVPPDRIANFLAGIEVAKSDGPIIAIVPGNVGNDRAWPIEHGISLARMCIERDWKVWLVGAGPERDGAVSIQRAVPAVQNMIGGTLSDAIVQIAAADAFVGHDGGLTHIAAALGKPVISAFGPEDPWLVGPINSQVRFVAPPADLGTNRDRAAVRAALAAISPERVMGELAEIVSKQG